MAVFLVAHGAWSAGWAWKKMHPLMRAAGHDLFTPTYTGLGERRHLLSPGIGLETHIRDILGVIECEDLRDFILIGHSYGGMVATAVADRAADRIAQLVYLDAFVPRDGESLFDLSHPADRERMEKSAREAGDGCVPANPVPPDTPAKDVPWIMARRMSHPVATFAQPVRLTRTEPEMPRTYIYCRRVQPNDPFGRFSERARREPGWRYHEMDASHSPHITAPQELAALLDGIARA